MSKVKRVLIFIALSEELKIFIDTLNARLSATVFVKNGYQLALINIGSTAIEMVITSNDLMGLENAEKHIINFLKKNNFEAGYFDFIVNIGIAGKISDDLKIGDVVFATNVDNYMDNTKILDDGMDFSANNEPLRNLFIEPIRSIVSIGDNKWYKCWQDCQGAYIHELCGDNYNSYNEVLTKKHKFEEDWERPIVKLGSIFSGPSLIVSDKFKKRLQKKDRKGLVCEMEAYGVVRAILALENESTKLVIIKGISDPSTLSEKKALDKYKTAYNEKGLFRKWAMKNATTFFIEMLATIYADMKEQTAIDVPSLDLCFNNQEVFLQSFYCDNDLPKEQFKYYESIFFRSFAATDKSPKCLDDLKTLVTATNNFCLDVIAEKGAGKSSFLAVLYKYFCLNINPKDICILYINFRRFHYSFLEKNRDAFNGAKHVIHNFMESVSDRPAILIFDDYNFVDTIKRNPGNLPFIDATVNIFKCAEDLKNKKIILGASLSPATKTHQKTFRGVEQRATLYLKKYNRHTTSFTKIFEDFISISAERLTEEEAKNFLSLCQQFVSHDINFFILTKAYKYIKTAGDREDVRDLAHFLFWVLNSEIIQQKDSCKSIDHVAEIIYNCYVDDDCSKLSGSLLHIYNNDVLRDYLVAYHWYTILCDLSRKVARMQRYEVEPNKKRHLVDQPRVDHLCYVFNNSVNLFLKEFISDISKGNNELFGNIFLLINHFLSLIEMPQPFHQEIIIKTKYTKALAQLVYVLGRIPVNQFPHDKLLVELENILEVVLNLSDTALASHKDYQLLVRSLYISLATLRSSGENEYTKEYIARLIQSRQENDLNRGFHLEYYGDQLYNPHLETPHNDKLDKCSNTFKRLFKKIHESIEENNNSLIEVDTFTLLSLIQHRMGTPFAISKKPQFDEMVNQCKEIIDLVTKATISISTELKGYIEFVLCAFARPEYHFDLFLSLFKLKKVLRQGWCDRFIDIDNCEKNKRIESVAEHTWSACLIA